PPPPSGKLFLPESLINLFFDKFARTKTLCIFTRDYVKGGGTGESLVQYIPFTKLWQRNLSNVSITKNETADR
ncbi:MAG: hypothetical protein J5I64_00565, partial [Saprospiraceae bacterium]|nr:hypothetical protein [Saprospiraceae bacterium]